MERHTPGRISEMLGIPSSTLRRYAKDYQEHLSLEAQRSGRKRRYTGDDVAVLNRVRRLLNAGNTPEDVNLMLHEVEADESTSPESPSPALEAQIPLEIPPNYPTGETFETLEAFSTWKEDLERRQNSAESVQSALLKRIDELEQTIANRILREEKYRVWRSKSWLRRLFTKPPE